LLPHQKRLLYRICVLSIILYRLILWFFNKAPLLHLLKEFRKIQQRVAIPISEDSKLQTLKPQHWSLPSPMSAHDTTEFVILTLVFYQPISDHCKHLYSYHYWSLVAINIIPGLVSIVLLN